MDTFRLDFITPEATFFSGDATQVDAPGTLGDFGVLPGHMPFISTLKPGVVTIHNRNEQLQRIFIAGGIAEVNPVSCTILAEHVVDLAPITRSRAEVRLAQAKTALDNAFDVEAELDARKEVELSEALLAAVTHAS